MEFDRHVELSGVSGLLERREHDGVRVLALLDESDLGKKADIHFLIESNHFLGNGRNAKFQNELLKYVNRS